MRLVKHSSSPACSASRPNRVYPLIDCTAAVLPYSELRNGTCWESQLDMRIDNEMYRRVVEAVPEGIWVVDPQGLTIFNNRRMAEILGVGYESMRGQSCFDRVFPDELAAAQQLFARTLGG